MVYAKEEKSFILVGKFIIVAAIWLSVVCNVVCNCSKFKFAVVTGLQNKTYWEMFGKENKIRAKDGFRGKGVKCTAEALIP